jgi:hypothetical protein
MARLPKFAPARGWLCYALWAAGVVLRWIAGFTAWEWRFTLPFSAALELAAFLIFFLTVSGHRPNEDAAKSKFEPWIALVASSMLGFLMVLILNVAATLQLAISGAESPALGHVLGQRLSVLAAWGFLVPAIWGFRRAMAANVSRPGPATHAAVVRRLGIGVDVAHRGVAGLQCRCGHAASACRALRRSRTAYRATARASREDRGRAFQLSDVCARSLRLVVDLLLLWVYAALADRSGGIWGAARHALTVGFISTMVFSIGQRILPAFGGARVLHSPRLMFWSLGALTIGCALRVAAEIPAYEGYASVAWKVLPWSAVTELVAVTLFASESDSYVSSTHPRTNGS